MPEFIRFLSTLREHMSAELTRSDVLRPLIWPNAGLLMTLIAALGAKAPEWALQVLVYLLAGFMLLYAVAYGFFAITDSDALRSERYKLQKMALEQGLYGDSIIGAITAEEAVTRPVKMISASQEGGNDA